MQSTFLQPYDRRGFTLAELLIAIVIFSAVLGMIYASYNMTFKVITNADSGSRYGDRARTTLERFTTDLESYYAGKGGIFKGETSSYGEYRGDSLSFTSTAHLIFNKDESAKGYATIAYTIEEQEGTEELLLYRADIPFLPGATVDDNEKGFLLCDGLREVAFTYIDENGSETETWQGDEKTSSGKIVVPRIVRLKLGFAGKKDEDEVVFFSTAVAIPIVK